MATVGKIVALHQHAPVFPQHRMRRPQYAAALLSPFDHQFCDFQLHSLIVTDGVMHGETLSCFDDFMAGDTYKIADETGRLASNDCRNILPIPANADHSDSPEILALTARSDVLRMTLLEDTGTGHVWYAVAPEKAALRAPYVLVPRTLPAHQKLTLIDAKPL